MSQGQLDKWNRLLNGSEPGGRLVFEEDEEEDEDVLGDVPSLDKERCKSGVYRSRSLSTEFRKFLAEQVDTGQ